MLDKNDRKYIIRRIITYIAIAMIMLLFNTLKTKALTMIPLDTQNKNFYWWCGTSRNSLNMGNERTVSSSCTNVSYSRYLIEWYINRQQAGTYTIDIPLDLNISTPGFDYSNYQFKPKIYVIDTEQNWKLVYGGVCNDFGGSSIHCTFTTNESFNYISTERQVAIASSSGVGVSGSTGTGTLVHDITQEDVNNSVQDVNDSLTDDTPPSQSDVSGNTSDWSNNNANNGVINQLVLMPVTLLQSFVNGINSTCQTYDFGELWGSHITLPCINLSTTLGSVWTIVDIIMSGIFIFIFGKKCVKIFNDFTNLKSGQIDSLYGGGE